MLRDLLDVLVDGSQGATRFALEGRSTASGPTPSWARKARHFSVLKSARSDVLLVEAPTLREIDPARFHQGDLFKDFDPDRSTLDLFEEGLADAIAGQADSDRFDDGLVKTYEDFEALFRDGAESVEFINGRRLKIEQKGVEQVKRLRGLTPPDQASRTAGKLDAIRHSDRQFTLLLAGGGVLRGVADDFARLKELVGREVVVHGRAVFKPSGAPLRIEAERIESASDIDMRLFARAPSSHTRNLDARELRRQQGPRSGVNAIIGQWPGDESDEEFARAVAAL
jgi:hypothetical protein